MIYTREIVMSLMQEKDKVEQTLKELWDVLKTNNVGMTESLIDLEGYPRSDIDVYQVRHARHQIKCLQNDHTTLLKRIEEGLSVVMGSSGSSGLDPNGTDVPAPPQPSEPFAKVDHVMPSSPAHIAGLQEGDLLIKFGSVSAENFRTLTDVSQVVHHSVNSPIQVFVRRGEDNMPISLTPRQWSGRGLLGCNLLPYERLER